MEANKIIITGGATRIGSSIAKKLSGPGVEIVIHYNKSKSKAEKLKKEFLTQRPEIKLVISFPRDNKYKSVRVIISGYNAVNTYCINENLNEIHKNVIYQHKEYVKDNKYI